jgi:hypothetical protein
MCAPFNLERQYGTEANCIAEEKGDCVRGLNYPWTGERIAKIMACATATTAQTCANYLAGVIIPDCVVGPGSIETGGICLSGRQCQGGSCRISSTALCGQCEDSVASGGVCRTNEQCPVGEVCSNMTCVKPAAAGAACNNMNKPCDAGLACVGATNLADGKCEKLVATLDGACDPTRATLPTCDSRLGFYCFVAPAPAAPDGGVPDAGSADAATGGADGATSAGKCARILLANAGQACGTDPTTNARTDCRGGNICQRLIPDGGVARSPMGICVADVGVDQPCNTNASIGPNCTVGLRCVATVSGMPEGTCKARLQSACPAMLP